MGTNPDPDVASLLRKVTASDKSTDAEKQTSSWVIPVITAVTLAVAFGAYYFVYVGSRREYIANRNFRALALLGEQLQQRISVHTNILQFCANLSVEKPDKQRKKGNLKDFLLVRTEDESLEPADKEREALKDYLKYLAPSFDLAEVKHESSAPRLQVERHNDRWELILAAFSGTDKKAGKDYRGSLKIDELMEPLVGSLPFDDILLVSKEGTVVYQSQQTGPRFTTLTALLQSQVVAAETKPAAKSESHEESSGTPSKKRAEKPDSPISQNADETWRAKSLHLTDVVLAATRYKLFLQPVLVSSFSGEGKAEPASEWVLCGLRSATALDWEALSLSFLFFIWFTVVFFLVWTSYKVLKIFFMNHRERLRLRELGTLGLSLVLLSSVVTLSLVQLDFSFNDDTDGRLKELGDKLSTNVHRELRQMRDQLTEWCTVGDFLKADLKKVEVDNADVFRNMSDEVPLSNKDIKYSPIADIYPYLNNAFWTDDDGHQIVKWSTTPYVTPMIDVSQLSVSGTPEIRLDGGTAAFHFASILPPNKLEYLATFSMKTNDCSASGIDAREDLAGGSAFLTVQPLSLIDPILPYGYGFAVVDPTGAVLFHSDKTRNGRENFLVESGGNKELYAAVFGHSSPHAINLRYMGRDHRARVVPFHDLSQAPWSLIVYRDLTLVRTLNLQVMAVASSLLILVLALPVVLISIWCVIRRPRFAPEWLWPNRRRMGTYLRQIGLYTLLIGLFLFLGFWLSSERIVLVCAAVPYAALSLSVWCFRRHPAEAAKPRPRRGSNVLAASAAAAVLLGLAGWWAYGKPSALFWGCGMLAGVSMLAGPRHYLTGRLDRWRRVLAIAERRPNHAQRGLLTYKNCYLASALLLLLLIGVLVPMALFRASLDIERRLGIKQAQQHLAAALAQRWTAIKGQQEQSELSDAAWDAFQAKQGKVGSPWSWIVPLDLDPPPTATPADDPAIHPEPYSRWFSRLLYALHHDYNESSAEMLGVLQDGGNRSDWSWENRGSQVVFRWRGAHPPALGNPASGPGGTPSCYSRQPSHLSPGAMRQPARSSLWW